MKIGLKTSARAATKSITAAKEKKIKKIKKKGKKRLRKEQLN